MPNLRTLLGHASFLYPYMRKWRGGVLIANTNASDRSIWKMNPDQLQEHLKLRNRASRIPDKKKQQNKKACRGKRQAFGLISLFEIPLGGEGNQNRGDLEATSTNVGVERLRVAVTPFILLDMNVSATGPEAVPSSAKRTDKLTVFSWAMWDWGAAAFNAVLVTFIFAVYLTDSVGQQINTTQTPAQWLSWSMMIGGLVIFAVTPVVGQRSDNLGRRRRALAFWSGFTFLLMAALFFIRNDAPIYFWLGLTILAIGSVTIQFAEVNYFAQLSQVSTEENVGRVSGLGWSFGYFGGIVLLLLCYFGFVAGDGPTRGFFNLSTEGGWNIRVVAILAAIWFGLSALPTLLRVPEIPPSGDHTGSIKAAYVQLFQTLKELWHSDRNAFYFLMASAIFRDGLGAIFAFGAVLGVSVYGLDAGTVLIFGVAANVSAATGAVIGGLLDDKIGPKAIIIACLAILTGMAAVMYFGEGTTVFWVCGLILCLCVGPAQSAARSFLTRVAPPGQEGQFFGLYATTGRAVSWLTPALFGVFVSIMGQGDRGGILAIGLVLLVGALILLPVKDPTKR